MTSSRSINFQVFGGRIFFGDFLAKKFQTLDFLEGKGYYFESTFYSPFGKTNIFALYNQTVFQ